MGKTKTHFEQVPIEEVKKIADKKELEKREIASPKIEVEDPPQRSEAFGVGT